MKKAWQQPGPGVVQGNSSEQGLKAIDDPAGEGFAGSCPEGGQPGNRLSPWEQGDEPVGGQAGLAAAGGGTPPAVPAGKPARLRQRFREVLAGLYDGLSPMLGKEMRSRTRGWRSPVLLTVYLIILMGVVVGILWLSLDRVQIVGPEIGLNLYSFFVLIMVLLLAFIAPAMAAGAISGERERRTYDLLMVTRASPLGIVLGKWLASVMYLLWLVIAALPVLAVVYLYGGVPARQVGLAVLVALVTGMSYGALGLVLSAVLKRSQVATIIAIILVFVLLFGTLVGAGFSHALASRQVTPGELYQPPGTPWYVFLSPLPALTSALPGGDGQPVSGMHFPILGSLMLDIWQELYRVPAAVTAGKVGYSYAVTVPGVAPSYPRGLAALAPWARFMVNQAILLAACLLVATLAVTPVKPRCWRRGKR